MRGMRCIFLVCLTSSIAHGQEQPAAELPRGIVLVANGSFESALISDNLASAVTSAGAPVQVERFYWGSGRPFKNFRHQDTHNDAADRLADRVLSIHKDKSYDRVYLIGFSAGTSVALAAAERLPPGSVDRVVLLGSGISSSHDLSRALQGTREGIDNFYSDVDLTILLGAMMVGPSDAQSFPPAGTAGFQTPYTEEGTATPVRTLRQHRWNPNMVGAGHLSNHLGYTRVPFLREYVVPLLAPQQPPN